MASINDISIAVNALFMDITQPLTLGLNKSNFLQSVSNVVFNNTDLIDYEFTINPLFRFDNHKQMEEFLLHELTIAKRYQDDSNSSEINELLQDINEKYTLDNFYLKYSIEISNNGVLVLFSTNSMVFKYELIS